MTVPAYLNLRLQTDHLLWSRYVAVRGEQELAPKEADRILQDVCILVDSAAALWDAMAEKAESALRDGSPDAHEFPGTEEQLKTLASLLPESAVYEGINTWLAAAAGHS